jgi:hypothetical protein
MVSTTVAMCDVSGVSCVRRVRGVVDWGAWWNVLRT